MRETPTPLKGNPRRASAINYLARTDVFFTIPVRTPKSKIPKPNNVRFRDLLLIRLRNTTKYFPFLCVKNAFFGVQRVHTPFVSKKHRTQPVLFY